jgi:hypothetical protein
MGGRTRRRRGGFGASHWQEWDLEEIGRVYARLLREWQSQPTGVPLQAARRSGPPPAGSPTIGVRGRYVGLSYPSDSGQQSP